MSTTNYLVIKLCAILELTLVFQQLLSQGSVTTFFPKQRELAKDLPEKKNVWVFLMAGQSNMAGRGLVEPQDTISDARIFTINKDNEIVFAKEPLHYYEPTRTGLDCGLSFARTLLSSVPKNVTLLMIPTAVGGSSIQRWLGDSTWHDVKLLSNSKEKIAVAKRVGVFKGILWHQGEANSNSVVETEGHAARLSALADTLRTIIGVKNLPFMVGELGSFSTKPDLFAMMNQQLAAFTVTDKYSALIKTGDLIHKGDNLHFDGPAQRQMGERFAQAFVSRFMPWAKRGR